MNPDKTVKTSPERRTRSATERAAHGREDAATARAARPAARRAAVAVAATLALAMAAAACAADGGTDPDDGAGGLSGIEAGEDVTADSTPDEDGPDPAAAGTEEPSDSPDAATDGNGTLQGDGSGRTEVTGEPESLADYLGPEFGLGADPEEQQAYYARQEQQVQELIAECMAQEGFEYIPAVRPIPDGAFGDFASEEFARERGFGITTSFGDEEALFGLEDDWTDPNQAIVEALSDSEREAYYETLLRPPEPAGTETDPDTGEEVEVYDNGFGGGCSGQAFEEIYAYSDLEDIYEQLDLESMYERMEADPRAQAMAEDWSQCMSGRGYDYEDPGAMYESVSTDFRARLEEITGQAGGFVDPFLGLSEEEIEELMADKSPQEMQDLFVQAQQEAASSVDQDALAALQDEERELAVANAECSTDMQQRIEELLREYEAELINDNRALLEQHRDDRRG